MAKLQELVYTWDTFAHTDGYTHIGGRVGTGMDGYRV